MRIYIIAAVAAMLITTVSAHIKGGIENAEVRQKNGKNRSCKNPNNIVLAAMACIEAEDVGCSAVYAPGFKKIHNEIESILVLNEEMWQGTFLFLDLKLETRYIATIGENQVSYRYIESVITSDGANLGLAPSVTYPFSQTFIQHKHALVTLDDDCKILTWDQYGDNQEQRDVDEVAAAMLCIIGLGPVGC
jgi:hypothetical protein